MTTFTITTTQASKDPMDLRQQRLKEIRPSSGTTTTSSLLTTWSGELVVVTTFTSTSSPLHVVKGEDVVVVPELGRISFSLGCLRSIGALEACVVVIVNVVMTVRWLKPQIIEARRSRLPEVSLGLVHQGTLLSD